MPELLVVGSGVMGLPTALEFRQRGWGVTVIDSTPHFPNANGASYDSNRIVRADYCSHEDIYIHLMEKAMPIWHQWNAESGLPLFNESGFLVLTEDSRFSSESTAKLDHDNFRFEYDCYATLRQRGYELENISSLPPEERRRRYPCINPEVFPDGYLNSRSGWGNPSLTMEFLVKKARVFGVDLVSNKRVSSFGTSNGRPCVTCTDGDLISADVVLLATGAYTPSLVPQLSPFLSCTAQLALYFELPDHLVPSFVPPQFPVLSDFSRSGFYIFPAHQDPETGRWVVKLAHHGTGIPVPSPDSVYTNDGDAEHSPQSIVTRLEPLFRSYLATHIPELAALPVCKSRICFYCDSMDGNFLIGQHPDHPSLWVASGDSGHGFKFAPVLGKVIADLILGDADAEHSCTFGWRTTPASCHIEGTRQHHDLSGVPVVN